MEPMIIALLRKEMSDSKLTDAKIIEDYKKFFGDIVEEFRGKINISCKHKKGNLKGVRYNSQTIGMCLSIYNLSPAAFHELQDNPKYKLPSERTIQRYKEGTKINTGYTG